MIQINFVRFAQKSETEDGGVWVDNFILEDESIEDVEGAMRAAVKEFVTECLPSDESMELVGEFFWEDAIRYVPDDIWRKHGIYPMDPGYIIDVKVDDNELLY